MALLWLYGIVTGDGDGPTTPGVGGGRPAILRHEGLGAVHEIVDEVPGISPTGLRRHDAIVQELLRLFPAVLPVRYGETAADPEDLRATLSSRATGLHRQLAELAGHVQMTLRVFARGDGPAPPVAAAEAADVTAAPPPGAGPGSRYLHQRRAALARTASLPEIEPLRRALAPLVRRQRIVRTGTDAARLVGTAYDLVQSGAVSAYRGIVDAHPEIEGYRLALSGPRPPWAFTDETAAPASEERP